MQKKPLTIIAEKALFSSYDFLEALGESVILHAFEATGDFSVNYDTDLFILDCGTAGDIGLMLIQKLKQSAPQVPVILIIDSYSWSIAVQAFKAGARDCFLQPVNLYELQVAVEKILCLKREAFNQRRSLAKMEINDDLLGPHLANDLPERFLRAINYIELNLSKIICLNAVAREACLSKFHFCRAFKRYIGMTPLQYVAYLRIEMAKEFLQQPEVAITHVAIRVGINDPSNFIKTFRKFTGMSPSEYRNLHTR